MQSALTSAPALLKEPYIATQGQFLIVQRGCRMEDLFLVEAITSWRWRCEKDRKIVYGSDLHILGYPGLTVAEWDSPKINIRQLRCPCGGLVLAYAPVDTF